MSYEIMTGKTLELLLTEIRACTHCAPALPLGPRPVLRAAAEARVLIIGQAPGTKVHETGIPWNDASGTRLRQWLDMSEALFFDTRRVAIAPMGFCYPGRNKNGGDAPPRPECAPQWHAQLLRQLPNIGLTLLVGAYAQNHYLEGRRGKTMTETVRNWRSYLPDFLPLPHPSWRNTAWLRRNPWFEAELVPELRDRVGALVG